MADPSSRSRVIASLWGGSTPQIVSVLGRSMEPSLEEGWRVRVEPLSEEPSAGDIVQVDIGIRPVLHRVIHVFDRDGSRFVLQRGDAGGALSPAPVRKLTGRAVAIASPFGKALPAPESMSPAVRRRFVRARRFSRFYARCRALAPGRRTRRLLDIAVALYGRPLLSIQTVVTFHFDLTPDTSASARRSDVREIPRDQVLALLEDAGFPPQDPGELDRAFGCPWRAFFASADGRPLHHCFVAMRPAGPHLFRAWTVPEFRRKGLFRESVRAIAERLRSEGYSRLSSYSMGSNEASMAAHRAAGFRETARRRSLLVLGVSPRWVLQRVIARGWEPKRH